MTYQGLDTISNSNEAHLGGNLSQGDPYSYAPSAWDYVINRFSIRSIMDLGSGLGYSAHYFHKKGVSVVAVDGMYENCKNAIYPTVQIDLTKTKVTTRVDLVHCQELVEHIEEKYLDNLLASLACGKIIMMTNALPGQLGHHHVNEQPVEYWIDKLKQYNCEVLVEDTNRVRKLAYQDGAMYLASTGLILSNKSY